MTGADHSPSGVSAVRRMTLLAPLPYITTYLSRYSLYCTLISLTLPPVLAPVRPANQPPKNLGLLAMSLTNLNSPAELGESPITGAATAGLSRTQVSPSQYSYCRRSVMAPSGTRDRKADPARPDGVPKA